MKHIKLILGAMVGIILVAGCDTKDLRELNVNPQSVPTINLNFIFTNAELGSASGGSAGDNRYIDWRTNIGMCSYAIQQLSSGNQGGIAPGDRYTDNAETANAPFEFLYGDELKNLQEIIKETETGGYADGQNKNLRQAARILKAQAFQRLTDYYGSIPYFEALKATPPDLIYFPKYDKQKDIYADLLKELEEATAAISTANGDEGFGAADMIYNGDIAKWKKFGFSLMLRMAMRVSNVDPATANTYVTKALAGGVFESNDDNVWIPMSLNPSQWTNQNGISRAFYPGDGEQPTFLSKTFIDWLKGTDQNDVSDDDPRLMIISGGIANWTPTSWTVVDGDPLHQKGIPNGTDQSMLDILEGHPVNADAEYSKINFYMLQNDDSYMIMNYAEVEFLQAEAAERGIGGATGAAAHYDAGVRGAMQQFLPYDLTSPKCDCFTVTDGQVDDYLATYPYVAGAPGLEMIGTQLWASQFMNWWEAWSAYRRSGHPTLTPVNYPGNVTNGTIPARLKYPSYEVSGNPNFGGTTPNTYAVKLWWAGGPE